LTKNIIFFRKNKLGFGVGDGVGLRERENKISQLRKKTIHKNHEKSKIYTLELDWELD